MGGVLHKTAQPKRRNKRSMWQYGQQTLKTTAVQQHAHSLVQICLGRWFVWFTLGAKDSPSATEEGATTNEHEKDHTTPYHQGHFTHFSPEIRNTFEEYQNAQHQYPATRLNIGNSFHLRISSSSKMSQRRSICLEYRATIPTKKVCSSAAKNSAMWICSKKCLSPYWRADKR